MMVRSWFLLVILGLLQIAVVAADRLPQYSEHQDLSYYLDSQGRRHPIRTIADWEIRRSHILAHMQTVMGPLPRPAHPVPLDVEILNEKKLDHLLRRKIAYHTDSPMRPRFGLAVPSEPSDRESPGDPLPASNDKNRQGRAGRLGPDVNLQYALQLADAVTSRWLPIIRRSANTRRHSIRKRDTSAARCGQSTTTCGRLICCNRCRGRSERIGCIGHSLGGHNTMFTAAFDPRIKALVSNCGFTRFHKYYGGKLKGWTSPRYMPLIASRYGNNPDRVPFDFTEIVACFAPRAFLASSPLHDSNFEVSGVRDVIAAARPIYALYGHSENLQANYPDAEHSFPPAAREVAYRFLDKHLKKSP